MTYNYDEWLKNPIKIFCRCGCNEEIIVKKRPYKYTGIPEYIRGHHWNGKHHTEESKQKIKNNQPNVCGKNNPFYGKKHSEQSLNKMIKSHIGQVSINKGKHLSEEHKQKLKENHADFFGENNPNYRGGMSNLPYSFKFNDTLKWQIRKRDEYQCQYPDCLCTQIESLILYGQSLNVHHIHYDKENCNPDLITLCHVHNGKVNFNRDYWEKLFINKLKEINLCQS